ncbi:MAG: NAD(+)--rifampin ADP-ribosyltransferase [Sphingobacteriales bacterium 17-39-43]|uniref:NAD(+)--rifampin ADP-ribosyltransferase n=1 Tax=Daejeonella sp. TaxID=2805397 RepID=UPI000BDDC787|nr:NAD(+)--rifampin ADP-ribosyltransferase [Daejeonella sp.]OYZ30663.1 MAG: NAD(+)--rifampin ADP-ribosyltransferase [Sphingobacteriales bacterium 16-39-50]OZA23384.1 MAG: NAD(+)--rifampin ADP-ribosyltransferase [Sphingobacteriales bacterium 17-39-43]HQS50559.1 NAD(+)--rifampin ADP-ribosyltransferase [Daejeonella sp.]HQT23910.1 NAD(+)--rifampin ADP-ribosyltransferase [Daejeonella sp.]HQT56593.1 NAD(+)--rifampin ADP-ribosyltransferase [Daejeonella sp.]
MSKEDKNNSHIATPFAQTYFHGTKAELKIGDLITVGFKSNYEDRELKHVYVSSTLNTAVLGAELASGNGREGIFLVEATGDIEDDPNVTDKKFPGNPTMSYRSKHPFKVIGEVTVWQGRSPEQIKAIKDGLEKLREQGLNIILD